MKRNICLLLAAVMMLLAFGGCSEPTDEVKDLYDKYVAAKELYAAGFDATVEFKTTVEEQSAEGEFHIKVCGDDVSITRDDSNDERHYVDGLAYRRGYFQGETYYEDNAEQLAKVCEEMSKDDFTKECAGFFCINPYAASFPTLTEEDLEDAEITESNGYAAIAVNVPLEEIKTYFADDSITEAEGVMVATFDTKGDMIALAFRFDVGGDDSHKHLFEITYDFEDPGVVPAVMKPENADDYIVL